MQRLILILVLLALPAMARADDDIDTCYSQQFTQREIDVCTKVIGSTRLDGKDLAGIYYERALKYRLTRQYAYALADVNTAVKLDPEFKYAYTLRAHVHADLGDFDKALADHNAIIKMSPDSAVAYTGRAIEYMRQRKSDLALADLNKSLAIDPRHFYGYFYRGDCYKDTGNLAKAIDDYEMAARLDPSDRNIKGRLRDARAMLNKRR
jgi:tetratricopeptide (TPR) repeat protein